MKHGDNSLSYFDIGLLIQWMALYTHLTGKLSRTDKYFDYTSHHQVHHKHGVMQALVFYQSRTVVFNSKKDVNSNAAPFRGIE